MTQASSAQVTIVFKCWVSLGIDYVSCQGHVGYSLCPISRNRTRELQIRRSPTLPLGIRLVDGA